MRVVHLNVRLHEGGAARVQLNLHDRLRARGVESVIAYGYGPKARPAAVRAADGEVVQVGRRRQVAANYATHRVLGVEPVAPTRQAAAALRDTIGSSDVVHLHAVHSYFLPLPWLVDVLERSRKPVVWTVHDDWVLTGRCAVSGDCERWRTFCGACPHLDAYPPALVDLSRRTAPRRRSLVAGLTRLVLVAPSRHIADRVRAAYPDTPSRLIRHGLDHDFEAAAAAIPPQPAASVPSRDRPLLIVATDLSDAGKTSPEILRQLVAAGLPLRLVGSNPPVAGRNIEHVAPTADRGELARHYADASALVFPSVVDSFGLVMVEAMTVGTPVLAVIAAAPVEVLGAVSGRPLDPASLVRAAAADVWAGWPDLEGDRVTTLRERATAAFSGDAMVEEYIALYGEVAS